MKRFLAILLSVVLLLILPMTAFAVADPPSRSTIVDKTVFQFPGIPGLEITAKNIYLPVADLTGNTDFTIFNGGDIKLFYGPDTTLSFNCDITIATGDSFKAGTEVKVSNYASDKFTTYFVVSPNGTFRGAGGRSFSMGLGERIFRLSVVDIRYYGPNQDTMCDYYPITDLAIAKSGESVKVVFDYDKDGTADYTLTIPGVIKTEKLRLVDASEIVDQSDRSLMAMAGKEFTVYTVKLGTMIDVAGVENVWIESLELKNGRLIDEASPTIYVECAKLYKSNVSSSVPLGANHKVPVYGAGSYTKFDVLGDYIWAATPFVPQLYTSNSATGEYSVREEEISKYNPTVIRVVKRRPSSATGAS